MFGQVVEATVTLVLLYLVVANADGFSKAVQAAGSVYVNAVTALQGRSQAAGPAAA